MKHLIRQVRKEFHKHLFDYLILITAGVFFLVGINLFKGERLIEFVILFAFASLYILWGIYHHILDHTLHLRTVLEYILIGFTIVFLVKLIIYP
jgi:hypothetical protein